MDITWFGRSCFRLQSSQATVLTDPFETLPPAALVGVDIVTLSDRSRRDALPRLEGARIVDGPGEYEIKGVPVTGVAVPIAPAEEGAPAPKNLIFSVVLDGIAVCHLGRMGTAPSSASVQEIGQADALLIPLGEPLGLSATKAVQLASQMEAKLLIPMPLGGATDVAALESFCKELGADPKAAEPRLTVSATAIAAQTRVAILTNQSDS